MSTRTPRARLRALEYIHDVFLELDQDKRIKNVPTYLLEEYTGSLFSGSIMREALRELVEQGKLQAIASPPGYRLTAEPELSNGGLG